MIREWWSKLCRILTGRQGLAGDLNAELAAHLEFEIQENIARGMPPDEARAAARRHVGNLTQIQERAADAWSFPSLETIAQDVRYGLRGIRRSPGFSLVVVLTLALGIGANTAIFSVVNAVLLRPLPYPAAERLVWLGESDPKAEGISVTWVNYQHWRNENHSFEDMAGFQTAHLTLTGRGEPLFTRAGLITYGFFGLVGVHPVLGRVFNAADDQPAPRPLSCSTIGSGSTNWEPTLARWAQRWCSMASRTKSSESCHPDCTSSSNPSITICRCTSSKAKSSTVAGTDPCGWWLV